MAFALEHDDRDIRRLDTLCFGDRLDVLRRRRIDVDRIHCLGAAGDLVHVDSGAGEEHRAALGDRDDRDRVRLA